MEGGVGDLDLGLGGILGGVLCGSCPVAPSITISTVAIDLASKWASIFWKQWRQRSRWVRKAREAATRKAGGPPLYRKITFSIRVCLVSEIWAVETIVFVFLAGTTSSPVETERLVFQVWKTRVLSTISCVWRRGNCSRLWLSCEYKLDLKIENVPLESNVLRLLI